MQSILAVDDSASMRQMVAFTLKAAGFDVVEAADGQEGLEKRNLLVLIQIRVGRIQRGGKELSKPCKVVLVTAPRRRHRQLLRSPDPRRPRRDHPPDVRSRPRGRR